MYLLASVKAWTATMASCRIERMRQEGVVMVGSGRELQVVLATV